MTVIALLNPDHDPHIVADTLLSADGTDPDPIKKVWLPALGSIQSEWIGDDGPWYVARLGRKTFFLPNKSGILAFAGDCSAAFEFWAELSNAFLNAAHYDPEIPMMRELVDRVLRHTSGAAKFSLLGVLIGKDGRREPYIHQPTMSLQTKNFGNCLIAGTGSQLVAGIIRTVDAQTRSWSDLVRVSPTENLAEHISAEMLYRDGDFRNGDSPSTPLAAQCGGFYEWYGVTSAGVLPLRSRLDLQVSILEDKLVATRIYFSEPLQKAALIEGPVPNQRYCLSVITCGPDMYELPLADCATRGWKIVAGRSDGVVIESTFELYDSRTGTSGTSRLSGPVNPEVLDQYFSTPVELDRVRLVVGREGGAVLRGLVTSLPGIPNVSVVGVGGQLILHLSSKVALEVLDVASRLV